jgi:hypothetical protein
MRCFFRRRDRDEYERFARERDRRQNTTWAMDRVETAARLLAMEDKKQSEIVYRRMVEKQFWVTPTLAVSAHNTESGTRDYESDARKRFIFPASGLHGTPSSDSAPRRRAGRWNSGESVSNAGRKPRWPRTKRACHDPWYRLRRQ